MSRRGPLVAALVGAGLVVLTVVGLILPKAGQVRSRQEDVAKEHQAETGLRVQLQQLQSAAQGADKALTRLKGLEAEIPSTADLPGLIRLVNTAAEESAVDFMAMAPSQPTPSVDGRLSVIATQITVIGGFFSVDQFLYRLETLPRISKVMNLTVTPGGEEGSNSLQAVMLAEFYTTDSSAGPGSVPGGAPNASSQLAPTPQPASSTPAAAQSPAPSPSASPTAGG
jgi:Tfp pilus assembly protein PilO